LIKLKFPVSGDLCRGSTSPWPWPWPAAAAAHLDGELAKLCLRTADQWRNLAKVPRKSKSSKLRRRKLDFRSLSKLPHGWKTKMQKDAKGIQRQMIRVYDGWPGSRAHMRWRGSSGDMSPKATAQVSALRSSAEERSRFSSLLLNQSLAEVYNSWYLLITLEPLQSIDVYWCPLTKSWHRKSAHCQRFLFDALTNDMFGHRGHRGHREARRPGDFCRALTKSPLWYMFSNSPCDLDTLWTVCHAVLSILFAQSIARCERDSIWIPCQSWKLKRFWSGWNQILQWLELDPHSWQHFWHGCSMLFVFLFFWFFGFWFSSILGIQGFAGFIISVPTDPQLARAKVRLRFQNKLCRLANEFSKWQQCSITMKCHHEASWNALFKCRETHDNCHAGLHLFDLHLNHILNFFRHICHIPRLFANSTLFHKLFVNY